MHDIFLLYCFYFFLHAQKHCKVKLSKEAQRKFDKRKKAFEDRPELYKKANGDDKEDISEQQVKHLAEVVWKNQKVFPDESVYRDGMEMQKNKKENE